MLKNTLGSLSQEDFVIVGGDFNCTLDFVVDWNGDRTTSFICESFKSNNHSVRVSRCVERKALGRISAARLDRFYLQNNNCNRVMGAYITPCIISDHQLITVNVILSKTKPQFFYWRFNVRLIHDVHFYENF